MNKTFLTLLLVPCAFLAACSNSDSTATITINGDSTVMTVESALSTINGALNDAEQVNSYAMRTKPQSIFSFFNTAEAEACSLTRFSPVIGSANCLGTTNNRTVLSQFNSCTAGQQNEFVFRGTVAMTFDTAATCNTWIGGTALPTTGNLVRTSTDFERFNPDGSSVKTSSAPHVNYLGSTIGGGIKTSFGVNTRTVEVLGLHRNGLKADGTASFDHSVYSTQPLVVTGTKAAGTREVTSGELKVDHNGLSYSVLASVSGLKWASNCCHPTEGTISWAMTGTNTGNLTVSFSTGSCGSAQVSYSSGSTQNLTLVSCE